MKSNMKQFTYDMTLSNFKRNLKDAELAKLFCLFDKLCDSCVNNEKKISNSKANIKVKVKGPTMSLAM